MKIQIMGEKLCLRHKGKTLHRGAFCQFTFQWIYHCHIRKSTGKETCKTYLCALLGIVNKVFVFKSLLTTSSNVLPLEKVAAIQILTTQWRVIRSNLLSLLKFSQLYVIFDIQHSNFDMLTNRF